MTVNVCGCREPAETKESARVAAACYLPRVTCRWNFNGLVFENPLPNGRPKIRVIIRRSEKANAPPAAQATIQEEPSPSKA